MASYNCRTCPPKTDKELDDEVQFELFNSLMSSTMIDPEVLNDPDLRPTNIGEYWGSFTMNERNKERRRKLKAEERQVHAIVKKLRHREPLTEAETEFYQEKHLKISNLLAAEVQVDAIDLLEDIVRGDYTLEDVHTAREGRAAATAKDPGEKSLLQLFDEIAESRKDAINEALNTTTGQFFSNMDGSAKAKLLPSQLKDAVSHAATAIDLSFIHQAGDRNEATEAFESYIKATAMTEAEIKLKRTGELMDARQDEEKRKAEVAAQEDPNLTDDRSLGFDITDLSYDITLVPSDDPNVYKPLEIISYIGMTGKPAQ